MRLLKNRLGGRVGSHLCFTMNPDNLLVEDTTFNGGAVSSMNKPIEELCDGLEDVKDDINKW